VTPSADQETAVSVLAEAVSYSQTPPKRQTRSCVDQGSLKRSLLSRDTLSWAWAPGDCSQYRRFVLRDSPKVTHSRQSLCVKPGGPRAVIFSPLDTASGAPVDCCLRVHRRRTFVLRDTPKATNTRQSIMSNHEVPEPQSPVPRHGQRGRSRLLSPCALKAGVRASRDH
jgi:hypothetical protein